MTAENVNYYKSLFVRTKDLQKIEVYYEDNKHKLKTIT